MSISKPIQIFRMYIAIAINTSASKSQKSQQGFTLVELMIVVAIVTIIASIVIPSYRSQIKQNAEHQAKQQALIIANQLSNWRAKRLTYSGFVPKNDCGDISDYCYSVASKGQIYVPLSSDDDDYRYVITLVDALPFKSADGNSTAAAILTDSEASGKGWRMLIQPNPNNDLVKMAEYYYLDSLGQRCRYTMGAIFAELNSEHIDCNGAGIATW